MSKKISKRRDDWNNFVIKTEKLVIDFIYPSCRDLINSEKIIYFVTSAIVNDTNFTLIKVGLESEVSVTRIAKI